MNLPESLLLNTLGWRVAKVTGDRKISLHRINFSKEETFPLFFPRTFKPLL